jgi:hypothetical protein
MTTEQVRDRLPEILKRLKQELAQPNTSFLPVLSLMSRLNRYSLGNQLLIYARCPTATDVRGGSTRLGFRVAHVFDRRQVEPCGARTTNATLTMEPPPAATAPRPARASCARPGCPLRASSRPSRMRPRTRSRTSATTGRTR